MSVAREKKEEDSRERAERYIQWGGEPPAKRTWKAGR